MAGLFRYRQFWNNLLGGVGTTTLYAAEAVGTAQGFANDAYGFLKDCLTNTSTPVYLPTGIIIHPDSVVDHLEASTGAMTGSTAVTPNADYAGTGNTTYSAASGACITFLTDDFQLGHRLKGRIFLVPLSGSAYDSNGSLSSGFLTTCQGALTQYIAKPCDASVWHRPTSKTAADGHFSSITAGRQLDKPAILTSRRD